MGNSCTIKVYTKNKKDEVVESRLFNDLLHYTNSRKEAKKDYAIGTNPEFIKTVEDRADFDENGEITFASLNSLANLNIPTDDLLRRLNEDIGTGEYSYDEAIIKLQSFNGSSQFNKDYMATLSKVGDKYTVQVIKKSPAAELILEELISRESLINRLKYRLAQKGVAIDFIGDEAGYYGRYSTKNAEKAADGFYHLIQVSQGEKLEDSLLEEAGHFAIGALGNNPLVTRLLKALTPEVIERIANTLGEKGKVMGTSPAREVAGMLVGNAFKEADRGPLRTLVNRIADLAKRIFYTFSKNQVKLDILEAKKTASQIAKGFLSPDFVGTTENALDNKETLYNAVDSSVVSLYKETMVKLKAEISVLKSFTHSKDKIPSLLQSIDDFTEEGRTDVVNTVGGVHANDAAAEGLATLVYCLTDIVGEGKEIDQILKRISIPEDTTKFFQAMPSIGKDIRTLTSMLSVMQTVIASYSNSGKLDDVYMITDQNGNTQQINLHEAYRALNTAASTLTTAIHNIQREFFVRFCQEIYGKKFVTIAPRVVFGFKQGKFGFRVTGNGQVEQLSIEECVKTLSEDLSIFDLYISSASNTNDLITQILDKAVKLANKRGDDLTREAWDKLRLLESEWKEFGLKTDVLYEQIEVEEKDEAGNITGTKRQYSGNIISDLEWGKWEREYQELREQALKDFKEANPDWNTWGETNLALRWNSYWAPIRDDWNEAHSEYDEVEKRYIPRRNYPESPKLGVVYYTYDNSDNFDAFIDSKPGLREWYNKYRELKDSLDALLEHRSTTSVRLPQFRGNYINRVRNKARFGRATGAVLKSFREELTEAFCETSEDYEYGSDNTYNDDSDNPFTNRLAKEREKIRRLPVYGINKLKSDLLSTDIFGSTIAYASMAYNYAALSSITDTLEVGREVLWRRSVSGTSEEGFLAKKLGAPSRAYYKLSRFLDKNVYSIHSDKVKLWKVVINKLGNLLAYLGALRYLGGNVIGGLVNWGTGFNELFKEAVVGQFFNAKDWAKANGVYTANVWATLGQYGKEYPDDKLSLFVRQFNITNENLQEQRDWDTNISRLHRMLNGSLFLPYKMGDHYMQTISYLALAQKTKVWYIDENGNKKTISLWDAYERVANEEDMFDAFGNKIGTKKAGSKLVLKHEYYKEDSDLTEVNTIKSIISKIDDALNGNGVFGTQIHLTPAEDALLAEKGLNIASLEATKGQLEADLKDLRWAAEGSAKDETAFKMQAQEISNRLHGIYNVTDKGVFSMKIYGGLVLGMKGWALGMMERRFAGSYYNLSLDTDMEGSIVTTTKAALMGASTALLGAGRLLSGQFKKGFVDVKGGFRTLSCLIFPFLWNKEYAEKLGFSKSQVANLKRNWIDIVMITLYYLLRAATALPPLPEEPTEEDKELRRYYERDHHTRGLLYYFFNRLFREQAALNLPVGMWYEKDTLFESVPIGFSALVDIVSFVNEFAGDVLGYGDKNDSTYYYQGNAKDYALTGGLSSNGDYAYLYEKGEPKWKSHFAKMLPYYKSLWTYQHPYKAASAFEYGKHGR